MADYPTPAEMARAQAIVDNQPVIGVYGACEWDELHDDGKVWIATIIREASRPEPQMSADEMRLVRDAAHVDVRRACDELKRLGKLKRQARRLP